ncbi:unnamed protein product, partial [Prunus brigantina]
MSYIPLFSSIFPSTPISLLPFLYKASLLSSSEILKSLCLLLLEREARAPNLSSWLLLYIPMFFRS